MIKHDAPQLLKKALSKKSWKTQPIMLSGVTDPYQPIEGEKRITRNCLKVLLEFRNPVNLITKNNLILRDLDILTDLAGFNCISVVISITSLDTKLCNVMEPRTSMPEKRFKAVEKLASSGIPVGVMIAPVIPGLNDFEISGILSRASDVGAQFAGYTLLRLPYSVNDIFSQWLETHFPAKKKKVISLLKDARNGQVNDTNIGTRMKGRGNFAAAISRLFKLGLKKYNLSNSAPVLSTENFSNPQKKQIPLFSPALNNWNQNV